MHTFATSNARHVQDSAPFAQIRETCLHQEHREPDVRQEYVLVVLVRAVFQPQLLTDAGVVDDDVNTAIEGFDCCIDNDLRRVRRGTVCLHCRSFSTRLLDLGDEFFREFGRAWRDVGDEDFGASVRKLAGDAVANTSSAAGDYGDFAL